MSDQDALLDGLLTDDRVGTQTRELMEWIDGHRKKAHLKLDRPPSEYPELIVTVPDTWETVQIAPLYDVHLGHEKHDRDLFKRHLRWIKDTPTVLTFNGGDLIDNSSKLSVGSGVYEQDLTPNKQIAKATTMLADIAHKMLFALPGNHEARTDQMGLSIAMFIATLLRVPYFPDYCFCQIRWRGNAFRLLAHHGSGAAQTAGGQRMAARKDVAHFRPFDLFWTGHLHSALIDVLHQTDVDQRTGRMHDRNGLVIISPSYLRYFGTYAATKRYPPGSRGLAVVKLREDGRIDAEVHANGRRL